MKNMRTMVSLVLLVLLMTTGVFASGQSEAEKPTVTVFWALYDGLTEAYREELEAAFEAEYPEIELDIVPVPWDQMYDRLTTSLAGGDPPEVSVIGTRWLLEFMALDAVVPVGDYVSAATINNIAEGAKEAVINDVLMGLPVAAGARILTINNDVTSVVPETMEELRREAIRVTDGETYGLFMPGQKHTELTDFAYYFYAAGGDFFEADSDGGYGRSTVNSDAGVKALEFMVELAIEDEVVPPGFLSMTRQSGHPVFYSGDVGYVMIGAWVESALEQAGADFDVTYAQIPGFEGMPSQPLIITDSLAMFSDAENLEEAGLFIDFFYQDEWKARFDELIGFPPVTVSAASLPQFQSSLYQALNEAALGAKPWPLMEGWAEYSDIIWDAVSEALLEQKTPQEALDDAAAEIDGLRGF
jgi:multiple sugar transport system substrate-binding protein